MTNGSASFNEFTLKTSDSRFRDPPREPAAATAADAAGRRHDHQAQLAPIIPRRPRAGRRAWEAVRARGAAA